MQPKQVLPANVLMTFTETGTYLSCFVSGIFTSVNTYYLIFISLGQFAENVSLSRLLLNCYIFHFSSQLKINHAVSPLCSSFITLLTLCIFSPIY